MKNSFSLPVSRNLRITLLLTICLRYTGYTQNAYWQQKADFIIDVTLNDIEHTLDGFEKVSYTNNSPDTLRFIWFHLWPNAYKNDKSAFSEQMLINDRTDFYFSDKEEKGYINRLDFKVNGITAKMEDHPNYIDVIRILLPLPLAPGQNITITTPFHVKLPFNFSRGGHVRQSYQVTQWYPKPAVYDRSGWHPITYLDQGEFYSEFGTYDVRITLPSNYVVAATGELQNPEEVNWLKQKAASYTIPQVQRPGKKRDHKPLTGTGAAGQSGLFPASSKQTKTIRYFQANIHDFAWFADKRFIVNYDTLGLASGKVIDVFSYYLPSSAQTWKNSISFIKDAVRTRSEWLGEYPYKIVSAAEAPMGFSGGMEYPTITGISPVHSEKELDITLAHEVGHNWLYGALATNERTYPWMDEGMNTFYDNRYSDLKYSDSGNAMNAGMKNGFFSKRFPSNMEALLFETLAGLKKDQPINTPSQDFTMVNYELVAYYKTGQWMKKLETLLGKTLFDSCMHQYYREWKFKHPYPEDFKREVDTVSKKNVNELFLELDRKGSLLTPQRKSVRLTSFFNLKDTHTNRYISLSPAIGANLYDGFMIGGVIHNYQLPLENFRFFVAPLYGTRSRTLNGLARVSYSWFPKSFVYRADVGASASRFSMNEFQQGSDPRVFSGFRKIAPFVRLTLKEPDPLSKIKRYIQFKSYFINEDQLEFQQVVNGGDTSEAVHTGSRSRVLHQLKFVMEDARILYPYRAEVQLEQQTGFMKAAFTGNYFFNYSNGQGGMNVRLFGGKFFYTGSKTVSKQFETERCHLNLTGPNGYEDYTYSNYFIGRNAFEHFSSQQIMMREGGFKVRTDLLSSKIGKSDNWLLATNLLTAIPQNINPLQILPVKIPIKVFADVGTFAEAWDKDALTNRFLFDAGLQLVLFRETVNVYVPLIYSTVFRDYFRSTLGDQRFWKTISFSIDIQNVNWKKINRNIPL